MPITFRGLILPRPRGGSLHSIQFSGSRGACWILWCWATTGCGLRQARGQGTLKTPVEPPRCLSCLMCRVEMFQPLLLDSSVGAGAMAGFRPVT